MVKIGDNQRAGRGMPLRLVVNGLRYKLPGSSELLLGDVTFDTGAQSRVGIIGRGGVGKTTLFRILAGLESDYEGEVSFSAPDPADVEVGYCFQDRRLMPWSTLRQNIEYAVPANQPPEVADELIDRLGLAEVADRKAR